MIQRPPGGRAPWPPFLRHFVDARCVSARGSTPTLPGAVLRHQHLARYGRSVLARGVEDPMLRPSPFFWLSQHGRQLTAWLNSPCRPKASLCHGADADAERLTTVVRRGGLEMHAVRFDTRTPVACICRGSATANLG